MCMLKCYKVMEKGRLDLEDTIFNSISLKDPSDMFDFIF